MMGRRASEVWQAINKYCISQGLRLHLVHSTGAGGVGGGGISLLLALHFQASAYTPHLVPVLRIQTTQLVSVPVGSQVFEKIEIFVTNKETGPIKTGYRI